MLQLGAMEEDIAEAELSLRAYLEGLGPSSAYAPVGFSGCVWHLLWTYDLCNKLSAALHSHQSALA